MSELWPEKSTRHRYRVTVNNALRDSKLEKSGFCQICGAAGEVEAHHSRYLGSDPQDVIWVCRTPCHKIADQLRKAREDGTEAEVFDWELASTGR